MPNRPAVLIAEDEVLVRLLFADILTDAGYRVIEAADAREALTVLQAEHQVLVLLTDVEMPPGINGYELARDVAVNWPEVEILIASGRHWPSDGELPPSAIFLLKPVTNERLLTAVTDAAGRAQARRRSGGSGGVVPPAQAAER